MKTSSRRVQLKLSRGPSRSHSILQMMMMLMLMLMIMVMVMVLVLNATDNVWL